jgi:hypothetical protein
MACKERERLLEVYEAPPVTYATVVMDLRNASDSVPKQEWDALFRATDRARNASEAAREALRVHACQHCSSNIDLFPYT